MLSSFAKTAATLTLVTSLGLAAQAELCSTESKGIHFINISKDTNSATANVLQQCKSSPVTDNGECEYNLACGRNAHNPYDSRAASCFTKSNSVAFQTSGSAQTVGAMTRTVVEQCQRTQVTDNSECLYNTKCVDFSQEVPYPSGMVHCTTTSHSIQFHQIGEVAQVSALANEVFEQCRKNAVTDNDECTYNLKCRNGTPRHHGGDGSQVPLPGQRVSSPQPISATATCRTSSHSISFRQSGPRSKVNEVTSAVLNQCQQNAVTDNDECVENLKCD